MKSKVWRPLRRKKNPLLPAGAAHRNFYEKMPATADFRLRPQRGVAL